jgi:phosphate transport system protein
VERPSNNYREIQHLGRHVVQMVRDSLDAFARLDTEAAVKVVKADSVVDEEYELISRQSITFMMEDPRTIRRVLDVMWAARALERVGDHAKNICEYVVFMVQGEDIRHTGLSHMEKAAQESGEG